MSRMKTLCLALFAVFALASAFAATSAFAELPDIHILSGEEYGKGVKGSGSIGNGTAVVAELETEIGEKLTAKKVSATAVLTELSSLGPGTLEFTGVEEPKSKTACNSVGDAAGVVLLAGEYHIVITNEAPLEANILILFNALTVECNSGKLKIKVTAPAIIKLAKVTSMVDVTTYGLVANCTAKGKQELKEYVNEEGKKVTANLTANFGLGNEKACERASQELVMTSEKMLEFLF